MKKLITLIPVVLLSACAVTDDPSQGGLISGVYGVTSGAYDQRLETRQHNLDALRQAQQGSTLEQSELQIEKSALHVQVAQLRDYSQVLTEELEKLNTHISNQQVATQKAQQRQQSLLKKVSQLQTQAQSLLKATAQSNDQDEMKKLQQEERRLQKEVKALQEDLYVELD